jgi:hypothetical protein
MEDALRAVIDWVLASYPERSISGSILQMITALDVQCSTFGVRCLKANQYAY